LKKNEKRWLKQKPTDYSGFWSRRAEIRTFDRRNWSRCSSAGSIPPLLVKKVSGIRPAASCSKARGAMAQFAPPSKAEDRDSRLWHRSLVLVMKLLPLPLWHLKLRNVFCLRLQTLLWLLTTIFDVLYFFLNGVKYFTVNYIQSFKIYRIIICQNINLLKKIKFSFIN
jgi:hypothetical protein